MKRIFFAVALSIFLLQPAMAQLFEPVNVPPPPLTIPNYGTNGGSVRGNYNVVSLINALISEALQGNSNVDLDSSFTVNSIQNNSSRIAEYAPLQNGFYLNYLGFESEIKKGLTLFGQARNQDDFNRWGDFKLRDGHFKYDFAYTKLINRQDASAPLPNAEAADDSFFFGFPNNPAVPGYVQPLDSDVNQLGDFSGFNPNQFFYPRIDDFLVNKFHYMFDSGFGVLASNMFRSQTGTYLEAFDIFPLIYQGPLGRDNNLSDTTAGVDYTSPSNLQFYASTDMINWNNQQQPRPDIESAFNITPTQLNSLQFPGAQPAYIPCNPPFVTVSNCTPNPANNEVIISTPPTSAAPFGGPAFFRDDDTRWSINQAGLRLPLTKKVSFTTAWKEWEKISFGVFNPSVNLIETTNQPFLQFESPATMLQPGYTDRQYKAGFDWNISRRSVAFFNARHWEEIPSLGVKAQTHRERNSMDTYFRQRIGNQSLSIYGAWEGENVTRLVDDHDIRIWWPFNPITNNTIPLGALGTATYQESNVPGQGATITFNPAPGSGLSSFTILAPSTFLVCDPVFNPGYCGTNHITVPTGGLVNVGANNINGIPAGTYPEVAPIGKQSFHNNVYQFRFRAMGPISKSLDYQFTLQRQTSSNAMFRTDPINDWRWKGDLNWNPSSNFSLSTQYRIEDNKTNSSFLYPYSYNEAIGSLYANYVPSANVSFFAGYRNLTQKINMVSPVFNTGTANFLGSPSTTPPGFVFPQCPGTDGLGTASNCYAVPNQVFGSGYDLFIFTPIIQYLSQPFNSISNSVRNQDQEISTGVSWRNGKNWLFQFDYTRSRPQTFQALGLTNQVFSTTCFDPVTGAVTACGGNSIPVTFSPNTPDNFIQDLPVNQAMQAVDGRRNVYSMHITYRLHDSSSIGFTAELNVFRNLYPRVTAIGIACGPVGSPNSCGSNSLIGQEMFQFGQSLDSGQVLSTSVYYSKNF